MSFNLHAGSMKKSRYNNFEQHPLLTKISAKKCCPLGSPSQQGDDKKREERDRELRSLGWPWATARRAAARHTIRLASLKNAINGK
jgi:hypothetical protein